MCCCGKPTINGELGYRWQPNDTPMVRQVNPPELGENDQLLRDLPGRCGGIDSHCHHFRIVKHFSSQYLLVRNGTGDHRMRVPNMAENILASLDSGPAYWLAQSLYSAHQNGAREAREEEAATWRKAAAEGRLKTRKQRGQNCIKVWIESELSHAS